MKEENFPSLPRCISFMFQRNAVYIGGFKNGLYHGAGKLTLPSQSICISGNFFNGDFTKGKVSYADGGCYEGNFTNFKAQGHGKYSKNGFDFICNRNNGFIIDLKIRLKCPDGNKIDIHFYNFSRIFDLVICLTKESQELDEVEYEVISYAKLPSSRKKYIVYGNESMKREVLLESKEGVQKYPIIIEGRNDEGSLEKVIEYEDGKKIKWTKFEEDDFNRPLCGEGSYKTENNRFQITGSVTNSIFTDCEILKFSTGTTFRVKSLKFDKNDKNKFKIDHIDQKVITTSNCGRSGYYVIMDEFIEFIKGNYFESISSDQKVIFSEKLKKVSDLSFRVEGMMIINKSNVRSIGKIKISKRGDTSLNHGISIQGNGNVNIFGTRSVGSHINPRHGNDFELNGGQIKMKQKLKLDRLKRCSNQIVGKSSKIIFEWGRHISENINYQEGCILRGCNDSEIGDFKMISYPSFGSLCDSKDGSNLLVAFGRLALTQNIGCYYLKNVDYVEVGELERPGLKRIMILDESNNIKYIN